MSDVRDQLIKTLRGLDYLLPDQQVADAILARFEVTPRPAISDQRLGEMASMACHVGDGPERWGVRFRAQLQAEGLTIVRAPEPTPTGRVG